MALSTIGRRVAQRLVNDAARPFLRRLGFNVTRFRGVEAEELATTLGGLRFLRDARASDTPAFEFLGFVADRLRAYPSRAQNFQDLFVLWVLGEKRDGYFVEFGATDGVDLSNSHLLETALGWTGVLAEPSRAHHAALARNRTCAIDYRCVYTTTGDRVSFAAVGTTGLSSIATHAGDDKLAYARAGHETYDVETVTLGDLLAQHQAPSTIDYLSIDTEGSELAILRRFEFSAYDVGVITVEHNYTAQREGIKSLLEAHGFLRVLPELSQADDWYVNRAWIGNRARSFAARS